MTVTIASVNVNGIRAASKKRNESNHGINPWLKDTEADIVLIQEVRATEAQTRAALAPALESGWNLVMAESLLPGTKGRAGVGILSRGEFTNTSIGFGNFSEAGRWIEADTLGIHIASLYLPSGETNSPKLDEKYTFLDEFADILSERAKSHPNMVIGGDWNICHRSEDLKNNKPNEKVSGHLPEERAFLDHVFGSFPDATPQNKERLWQWQGTVNYSAKTMWQPAQDPQWFDISRRLAPEVPGPYTWWTYRGQAFNNDAGWRIDYQAATKAMLDRAEKCWVEKAPSVEQRWSDHAPLLVRYA
ncbi:exodeoxyribonuclease III [Corynebacterium sp. ES2715-CONJ3]|uniref:exodeoxyribonuclease III n=1 Tax=Corynebacterium sp. ES2715-CONJ3 TaxID=2974028 RepID=UPI002167FC67|nr:exodeoxyribonuclease III [Corynebacterium sp. ES2715-CONJ3]MCS4492476.1 exodeoxyribonuclease III [Corynebacterium sp. ES2715-CONJ3]